jgi:hypothetical protein
MKSRITGKMVVLILLLSGMALNSGCSCSGCGHGPHGGESSPAAKSPAHGDKGSAYDNVLQPPPAKKIETAPQAVAGSVSGVITLHNFADRSGNLYVFILDEQQLPDKVATLASVTYSKDQIKKNELVFELTGVPAGSRRVTAVWDVAEPRCGVSAAYCAASHKDAIGQTAIFNLPSGGSRKEVNFEIY